MPRNSGTSLNVVAKIACTTKNYSCHLKRKVDHQGSQFIQSQFIRSGDLLYLKKNQRSPADCVLLHTSEPDGLVYTKTDQLDGETDWKVREALRSTHFLVVETQKMAQKTDIPSSKISKNLGPEKVVLAKMILKPDDQVQLNTVQTFGCLFENEWRLRFEAPNDKLHDFNGVYTDDKNQFEPFRISNTILAHMSVVSGDVLVKVLYVGRETRMSFNSKKAIDKFGRTDQDINNEFKVIFMICLTATLSFFFFSRQWQKTHWWNDLIRVFLILSSTLPFMLKLNVDIAKLFYSSFIERDPQIAGTVVRNRQIPEELGRVEYLLCDKTGTLTKNEMTFKQLVTMTDAFGISDKENIASELNRYYKITNQDLETGGIADSDYQSKQIVSKERTSQSDRFKRPISTEETRILADCFLAILTCNNVSPTVSNETRLLQASSPDEVSLVEYAEYFGFQIVSRKKDTLIIKTPDQQTTSFKILQNFPFSSERKRMGIILRNEQTNELKFLLKGADSIMEVFFDDKSRIHLSEKSTLLSNQGLRTLVIGQRVLSETDYQTFRKGMNEAQHNLKRRNQLEEICIHQLEQNLEFLCVTGVEDVLQDSVKPVISSIRDAGIHVWMLTGDKLETAQCVAVATGFKSYQHRFHVITESDEETIIRKLRTFNPINALVVSGDSLEVILRSTNARQVFFENAMPAKSVVLCRCAPKQKAEVAILLKLNYGKIIAAIGDGGNDVGMIQSASVGIGIEGREGLQASLASDFSVPHFKSVLPLFLWHGRMSFVRTSKLAGLVVHRAFLLVTLQYLFMCVHDFLTIRIYNSYLTMFYGTLFTNLIVFSVIFEKDIAKDQTLNYPSLYRLVQNGCDTSVKNMLIWKLQGIFQAAIIIFFALFFFPNLHQEIQTVTFSAIIFVEYLNIYTVIITWDKKMSLALLVSATFYLLCLFPLRDWFKLTPLNPWLLMRILALVTIGWLPLQISYTIQAHFFANPVQKLFNETTIQEHRNRFKQFLNRKTKV